MATSVKISKKDKAQLERLQALLTLRAGTKITQQEILSALIGDATPKEEVGGWTLPSLMPTSS